MLRHTFTQGGHSTGACIRKEMKNPGKWLVPNLLSTTSEHIQYSGENNKQYHDKAGGNALFDIFCCMSKYSHKTLHSLERRPGVTEAIDYKCRRKCVNIIFKAAYSTAEIK